MPDNFFTLLGIPQDFAVDSANLERLYLEQQRQFHPDRLIGKSAAERHAATLRTMQINEAYHAVKDPLKRARHLLALQGVEVGGERDTIKPGHALLTEIMGFRESVDEADSAAGLEVWKQKAESESAQTRTDLQQAFTQQDLHRAAQLTMRLGYLKKIDEDIRVAKKRYL